MKSTKKPIKKTVAKKAVAKKTAPKKKIVIKKAIVTKKKSASYKKPVNRKNIKKFKTIGIVSVVLGLTCMLALLVIAVNGLFSPNETSVKTETVLGWATKTSNSVSAPTGIKATSKDSFVTLTWKSVSGANGYNIYRASGIFGKMSKISYVTSDNLKYTDNTTLPRKIYRYQITTVKGTLESKKSVTKVILTSSLPKQSAPVFDLTNPMKSGYAIILTTVNMTRPVSDSGFYIYCDKCVDKKVQVSYLDGISSTNVIASGRGSDGTNSYMSYQIKGLQLDTKYSFQLTKYIKTTDGKITESSKSASKSITTPAESSTPTEPTGFKYLSRPSSDRIVFRWDVPTKAVDGYVLSIACKIGDTYIGGWNGTVTPYQFDSAATNPPITYFGFDIDNFGIGKGTCTARLGSYFSVNGEKSFSTNPIVLFDNGTQTTPDAPTGFTYNGKVTSNGVTSITFRWDIPNVVIPASYVLGITCSGLSGAWENGSVVPYGTHSDVDTTVRYGYDIPNFGTGYGNCTATLTPYLLNGTNKIVGPSATAIFTN